MSEEYTGVTEAAAPSQLGEEISQQERHVPLSALEAERSQRQQLQDEVKMMKEHLNLLQARQQPQQQVQTQSQYDDDDVMTFGDFKKVAGEFQSSINGRLTELQMMQQYPDYRDVVSKYLPEVLKTDPALRQDFENSPNYYRAYYMAKNSEGYRKDHAKTQVNVDAQRIMENSERSGSLSAMGGVSPMNQTKRYKDMSDADFSKLMAKNRGYT